MTEALLDRVRALPIWRGHVTFTPLDGGITNVNHLACDGVRRAVVRLGADIPVHQVMRFNELAASQAAHAAGISPEVLHAEPGLMVIEFIEGRTLAAEAVAQDAMLARVVDLVARAHRDMPAHLRGATLAFWVYHVIRDYGARLIAEGSPRAALVPELLASAARLEVATGPIDLVFGHNDLLPANLIDDGTRLWLIDWDYAGWGSPLFDLGGLAANNGLTEAQELHMLEAYFGALPDGGRLRAYRAMKCAAALRETLWSMVSETHSTLDFDFATYTETNMATFRAAMTGFLQS